MIYAKFHKFVFKIVIIVTVYGKMESRTKSPDSILYCLTQKTENILFNSQNLNLNKCTNFLICM